MAPKATDKDEIVKTLNFMKKVEPLTSSYDISKFNPLLLPNGVVKEWMITAVQSGNQDGLTVWSELVRILGKKLISYYISKAKITSFQSVDETNFRKLFIIVNSFKYLL